MNGHDDRTLSTLFRVPNTPEGNAFLKQMRSYAIKGTRIIPVGRGPRAKHAKALGRWARSFDTRLPRKYAEYFAIYIRKPALDAIVLARDREAINRREEHIRNLTMLLASAYGNTPDVKRNVNRVINELRIEVVNLNAKRRIKL